MMTMTMPASALVRQLGRFAGAGVVNTLVTLALYQVLVTFMTPLLAYVLTWLVGLVFVMLVYPKQVFRAADSWRNRAICLLVYVAGFVIGCGVIQAMKTLDGGGRWAVLAALVMTTGFNFVIMKLLLGAKHA